ncbi:MAG: glycosyltransferase [Lewinellaceae bacterium]|nr:glycosyltransferase [Saprospiraceae bacterium]MCB9356200.1 glycosyltransferase [Lewinellaceae bacterium]
MKFLIVTAWYHPFIHPRAHRWTALAEYLAATGDEVHILCARQRGFPQFAIVNGVHVHRSGFDSLKEVAYYLSGSKSGRGRVGAEVRRPGFAMRLANWLYNKVWKNVFFPDDACLWYFPARRSMMRLLEQEPFDVLLSVSLPFTGHLLGLAAKRRYPALRWIADVGDPFSMQIKAPNNKRLYGRLNARLEKEVLESADAVAVTTPAMLHAFHRQFGDKVVAHMQVVPPLLHPAPGAQAHAAGNADAIGIAYFGALYAPLRTPDAFLRLLDRTVLASPTLAARLQVHFYGEIFPEFYEKMRAQPLIRLHGLRSREEARQAMRATDLLLNIGNASEFQLPSKAVDYLAAGRPVVHLSYTDNDPFVAFWGDREGLLGLRVVDGDISEADFVRWLDWLAHPPAMPDDTALIGQLQPYLVPAIAERYRSLASG